MNLKFLLIPITMFIWYLIVYNVFYYSMVGVLLTFSFKWYFLIISSSILCFFYMMYVSFITSVLGGLIQRLYVDNFWIKLSHIVIGLFELPTKKWTNFLSPYAAILNLLIIN